MGGPHRKQSIAANRAPDGNCWQDCLVVQPKDRQYLADTKRAWSKRRAARLPREFIEDRK